MGIFYIPPSYPHNFSQYSTFLQKVLITFGKIKLWQILLMEQSSNYKKVGKQNYLLNLSVPGFSGATRSLVRQTFVTQVSLMATEDWAESSHWLECRKVYSEHNETGSVFGLTGGLGSILVNFIIHLSNPIFFSMNVKIYDAKKVQVSGILCELSTLHRNSVLWQIHKK